VSTKYLIAAEKTAFSFHSSSITYCETKKYLEIGRQFA